LGVVESISSLILIQLLSRFLIFIFSTTGLPMISKSRPTGDLAVPSYRRSRSPIEEYISESLSSKKFLVIADVELVVIIFFAKTIPSMSLCQVHSDFCCRQCGWPWQRCKNLPFSRDNCRSLEANGAVLVFISGDRKGAILLISAPADGCNIMVCPWLS
jgi:hypothetical protein